MTFIYPSNNSSRSNQWHYLLFPFEPNNLSETFLSTGFSFRDIELDHLKWDTLYTYMGRSTSTGSQLHPKIAAMGCVTNQNVR